MGESFAEGKEVSHMILWDKSIPDRGKSSCRGVKVDVSIMYSRNIQNGSLAGGAKGGEA